MENMLLTMVQRGQITEQACCCGHACACILARVSPLHPVQVSDAQLLTMLEKVNEQMAPKATTVRKKQCRCSPQHR